MRERNSSDRKTTGSEPIHQRVYFDAEGQRWQVFEKPYETFDRRNGMSLIFSSDGAMRRVRNYPANWSDLSDEELVALSWSF